jgi:hypothetical protein
MFIMLKKKNSTTTIQTAGEADGLSVKAYKGDGAVLLAFDLDEHLTERLAGFAVKCVPPSGKPYFLNNRLNFKNKVTTDTTPAKRVFTPTNIAPFQTFRWTDFPPLDKPGKYHYEVSAMYFKNKDSLKTGPTASVSAEVGPFHDGHSEIGFTRGYLSSQAYADRFKNAPFRPDGKKTIDYDTTPFKKQYEWLGYHARQMVFDFMKECVTNKDVEVDVFAYDLDEPDFVRDLAKLGKRLRIFLDDSNLHVKKGAMEIDAKRILEESTGPDNIRVGHFGRFAHNKVVIQKKNGKAVKVLTGSANFSVRGLYVQANNVLVFDDPKTADLYERAFEQSFADTSTAAFKNSEIAENWFNIKEAGMPPFGVCFSPHKTLVSLDRVVEEINKVDSSIMFAVMELGGSGKVLEHLRSLAGSESKKVYTYGITETQKGISLYKPGKMNGVFASFDYLKSKVPSPFRAEWGGGLGQVIHHKFIVMDFNDLNPVVFTGSSNLAAGGEKANGDNLLAIFDRAVATAYAVEAVRLVDHYHFRTSMKQATSDKPLMLKTDDEKIKWWSRYYNQDNPKFRERKLFIS